LQIVAKENYRMYENTLAENAKLRRVLCIAQEVVNSNRGGLVPGYKFGKLEQALAKLDEEGER